MSQAQRIYAMKKSLKNSRAYGYEHYRKGYLPGPYMMIARTFGIPIKEVKRILAEYKEAQ